MASHETLRENSGNIPMAPGKHNVSFDTILSQAKEWTDPGDISEAEVARSGIASILRELDDAHKLSHGEEVQMPPLHDSALGVITRALNNGAPERMDDLFGASVKKFARTYEEAYGATKKWDTKNLALAGQRELITGVLEDYTEYLDTKEAFMRGEMKRGEAKYSENTFRELYRERSDAIALADLIFETSASKREQLQAQARAQEQAQKKLSAPIAETTVVTFKEPTKEKIRRLRMKEMQVSRFDIEYPDSDYANIMPSSQTEEGNQDIVSDTSEDTIIEALTEEYEQAQQKGTVSQQDAQKVRPIDPFTSSPFTHEDFRKIVPPPSDKDAA